MCLGMFAATVTSHFPLRFDDKIIPTVFLADIAIKLYNNNSHLVSSYCFMFSCFGEKVKTHTCLNVFSKLFF